MKKSFTLVELLIVIVVIGVITTLVIPRIRVLAINARGPEAMHNLRMLADSAWRHYLETGDFPPTQSETNILPKLDYNLPSNPMGYFSYKYSSFGEPTEHVQIWAVDPEVYDNGPTGTIFIYYISYIYDTPTVWGEPGHKMDEHWYRHYAHWKIGKGYTVGWP